MATAPLINLRQDCRLEAGALTPPARERPPFLPPRPPQSLQKGTFDSKHGEYEWVRPAPGMAAGASRRKFYL